MKKYMEKTRNEWTNDSVRIINTPSPTAKAIYFYLQEAGYFKTIHPYYTKRENLNSFLVIYTLSGEGTLSYQGKEYSINAGQCFFIHCMELHSYETKMGKNWEFLWLHFNGGSSLGYYKEFVKNGFSILTLEKNNSIEKALRALLYLCQNRNALSEILVSNQIDSLLTALLLENAGGKEASLLLPTYIKQVVDYIERHFKEPLSLDDLSLMENISKFHLSHEFKRYMGITLNEYIILTRLSYAKELLKYSELSINEIVFQCGMNHVSHFINLFKAREGLTPNNYRQQWKDTIS